MYQTINEQIIIAGVYQANKFIPKKFKWGEKTYLVDEITLSSDFKDGGVRKRAYSVVSSGNVFRLEFNRETEGWWLREIWVE